MKKIIILLFVGLSLFSYSIILLPLKTNYPLGGCRTSLTHPNVSAYRTNGSPNFTIISWNNSYVNSGQSCGLNISIGIVLERSNQNNGYDTIFQSNSIVDTLFVDSMQITSNTYHYRLNRLLNFTYPNSHFSDTIYAQTVDISEVQFGSDQGVKVVVCPNPTNGLVTIKSEVGIEEIEVLNLSGASTGFNFLVPRNRNTQPNKLNQNGNADKRVINLSNLKKGIYFLKVTLENGEVIAKKVVKQ